MNSLDQLVVVLPCHTIEDLAVRQDEPNASSILANWTALWHPALIARSKQMPDWVSSDFVTREFDNALVMVPLSCVNNIPLEIDDAQQAGKAELVLGATSRIEIQSNASYQKWISKANETEIDDQQTDDELVTDFFALGYAYLQIQLMTRQLRYSSSIDIPTFQDALVAAATAAIQCNHEDAKAGLQRCFDMLAQERSSYYPSDPTLLDLVLVAPSTIGKSLGNQLQRSHPTSWLLSGSLMDQIRTRQPDALQLLKTQIDSGKASIIGGQQEELPARLMPHEATTNQIARGIRQFAENGIELETFASRMFGLGPHLPPLLTQFDFRSTIHATFSGGDIPINCAPVMNWQGSDGTNLSALGVVPIDADSDRSFLGLSIAIGETLDSHHHCPILFVHWPGRTSEYFDDLFRVLKYCPLFGEFVTFNTFNDSLYDNGFSECYESDEYRFEWLNWSASQDAQNPISRYARYWRRHYFIQSCLNTLSTLAILDPSLDCRAELMQLDELGSLNDLVLAGTHSETTVTSQIRDFTAANRHFSVGESETETFDASSDQGLYNPSSVANCIERVSDDSPVVETIQPFSFLSGKASGIAEGVPDVVVEDPNTGLPYLRNDLFEIRFDQVSGGIRSVNRHGNKGNLFSQHLAIRLSETVHQHGYPRRQFRYTSARLDSLDVVEQRKSSAAIRSSITLVDESNGTELACVEQWVKLARKSNLIEFKVNVQTVGEISKPLWSSYLCSRFAFPDRELVWQRDDFGVRVPIRHDKVVAPEFVEVVDPGNSRISLLSGGLPFHRRVGDRMLDSLLIVAGESVREFEFGIAVDSPTSAAAAIAYLSPPVILPAGSTYCQRNGWIFSCNCKNVVVTYLRPIYDESGKAIGVTLRLIETEKRSGELTLRFPFNLTAAARTNFLGEKLNDLDFDGDRVICNFCEHQYFQLECCW